jgi:hypothetical protein
VEGEGGLLSYAITAARRGLGSGGEDPSVSFPGSGSDVIIAADGRMDVINCGSGRDTITVDKNLDVVAANCERINPRAAVTQSVSRGAITQSRSIGE